MRLVFALVFVACAPQPSTTPVTEVVPPATTASSSPADAATPVGSIETVAEADDTVRTHEPSPEPRASENRARCERGEPQGCHAAALDAYYSPPSATTDREAREYFQKACDAGYAPSCNGIGVLHHEGRGLKQDDVEAARWYRRSCLDGASTGCQHLGDALRSGRGVPKDPKAAERAAARGNCVFEASLHDKSIALCPGLGGDGGP